MDHNIQAKTREQLFQDAENDCVRALVQLLKLSGRAGALLHIEHQDNADEKIIMVFGADLNIIKDLLGEYEANQAADARSRRIIPINPE